MPTSYISFLQLGDVHFPDLLKSPPLADVKDKGFSTAMTSSISSNRIAEIVREINKVKEQEDLVAIILTGDLTTRGNTSGYEECLNFLHGALQLSDSLYWKNRKLLAVPGNHDINRRAIVSGQPLEAKFEPLLSYWEARFGSRDFLTVNSPIPTDLPPATGGPIAPSVRFLPLNTCYLCGEHRAFPIEIREKLIELLEALKLSMPPDEFESLVSEQIDCPAVSRDHIGTLTKSIAQNSTDSISVVIGHHPLFPQPMPRIDGYNELLNAGFIRESVLETRRNVIYLHGHIHQDPLLLVSSPLRGSHRLIHISAPALEDGFNLIKVFFSDETNQPLGVELIQYRFGDHLGLVTREPIRLRLIDQEALWNEVKDPWANYVLNKLNSPQVVLRFNDLLDTIPAAMVNGMGRSDQAKLIEDALLVLELLELVEITNRQATSRLWQCRRRVV